jgi:hypothetical protein
VCRHLDSRADLHAIEKDFNQPTVVEADRRGVAQATGVDIEGLDESPVRQKRAMANRQLTSYQRSVGSWL